MGQWSRCLRHGASFGQSHLASQPPSLPASSEWIPGYPSSMLAPSKAPQPPTPTLTQLLLPPTRGGGPTRSKESLWQAHAQLCVWARGRRVAMFTKAEAAWTDGWLLGRASCPSVAVTCDTGPDAAPPGAHRPAVSENSWQWEQGRLAGFCWPLGAAG